MPKEVFRITQPTIALFEEGGRHVAHTVPEGSIVTLEGGPLNGNKLVTVIWNDRKVMMFTQDLRSRSHAVQLAATSA